MITIVTTQSVQAGKEKVLENLMEDLIIQIKDGEPGCSTFQYVRSTVNPECYLVYERYIDQQALTFHQGTGYLKQFIPKMMDNLTQPPIVTVYEEVQGFTNFKIN